MNGLRKFLLVVVCFLYLPLLLALPVLISLNATIANQIYVKKSLVNARFYNALSETAIAQATKDPESANNVFVVATVKEVASPEGIQQILEPTITSFYTWLDKPEGTPNLTIGLKPIQDKFKQVAEQKLQEQLATLPKCKTTPVNTDPTTLTCLPPGMTVQQLLEQAKVQISQQANQIGDQQAISLTEDQPDQPKPAADAKKVDTPKIDTKELKRIANVYHWVKVGLPIVEVVLGVCTLAIVLLSRPVYKALKRIGWIVFTAGLFVSVTGFGTAFAARILIRTPATDDAISKAAQSVAYEISDKILAINTKFMIGYLGGGIVLLIISLIITKTRHPKLKAAGDQAIEKDNMLPDDDKKLNDKDEKPAESEKVAEPPKDPSEVKIDVK